MSFIRQQFYDDATQTKALNGIQPNKLAARLTALSQIGRTKTGGVTRLAYTNEEAHAKRLLKQWGTRIGLTMREDEVGNLIGRLEGTQPDLGAVATGSHIDTVVNGGAFDGALGTVASLCAIESLLEDGKSFPRPLEWIIFVNEEGSRFPTGIYGSQVMMGEFTEADLERYSDKDGVTLVDALKNQGFDPHKLAKAHRQHEDFYAFIELHIEQGKQLEKANIPIGVVSGIAGPLWLQGTFKGESDHAGNTPMGMRKDAAVAGAEWLLAIESLPAQFSQTAVATVGQQTVYPNTPNVISGEATLTVDIRDIELAQRNRLVEAIQAAGLEIAAKRGLDFSYQVLTDIAPVPISAFIQETIKASGEKLALPTMTLPSGAGHDAMIIGRHVPHTGMIFVPSVDGRSHCPEEFTSLDDCVKGTAVLKDVLAQLLTSTN